jgi:hypothetical protein
MGIQKNDVTEAEVSVLPSTPSAFTYPDGGSQTSLPTPPGYWGFLETTFCLGYRPAEAGFRFVDVNADGKADYVEGDYNYTTGMQNDNASINTYTATSGYGWNGSATGTIPYFAIDGSGSIHGMTTGLFGDINGDGLPDYEGATGASGSGLGGFDTTYLGNGSLWDSGTSTIFTPKQELPAGTPTVTDSQLIDINGDGLGDWVYGNTYVLLNTGTDWESTPSSQWTIATSTLYLVPASSPAKYYDRGIRFVDINGDGLGRVLS